MGNSTLIHQWMCNMEYLWDNLQQNSISMYWTSLVAQWLRIRLPMQGTLVRVLVQEDPTCHGATKPVRHKY